MMIENLKEIKIWKGSDILKDYNNVKNNPDIEMGTIFKIGRYICEVDDYNYDEPNESIVFIYKSKKDYEEGNYLEQVSLLNKNIKQNIEDYMREKKKKKIPNNERNER